MGPGEAVGHTGQSGEDSRGGRERKGIDVGVVAARMTWVGIRAVETLGDGGGDLGTEGA